MKNQKNKGSALPIIILVIIIIAVIGGGAYFYSTREVEEAPVEELEEETKEIPVEEPEKVEKDAEEDEEIFCGKVSLEDWELLEERCKDLSSLCEEAQEIKGLVCMGENILNDCRKAKIEVEFPEEEEPIQYFKIDKYNENHCLYTLVYADEEYFEDKDKIFANTEINCALGKPLEEYNSESALDYPGNVAYNLFLITSFHGFLHAPECEGSYYEPFHKGIKCLTDEHCAEGKECEKTNLVGDCVEEEKIDNLEK